MSSQVTQKPTISIVKSKHVVDDGLAELYQTIALQMALLRKEGDGFVRITPFVQCRDFLVDIYTFSKVGKHFNIYGCSFNPEKELPDESKVYLALRFPNKVKEVFDGNLDRLHAIECHNGWELTTTLDAGEGTTVTIGSGKWLQNCLLFSLYTSLLRLLCYSIDGDGFLSENTKGTDADLFKSVAPETWRRVVLDLDSIHTSSFCGFDPQKNSVSTIHHNSGFYSVFGSHRELDTSLIRENAHWKHFKEQGWKLHTN